MRAEMSQRDLWKDTIFPGFHISPILGDLLGVRIEEDSTDIFIVTLKAFRLALILYVGNLRAKFGIDTLSAAPRYATKLGHLLSSSLLGRGVPPVYLIWIFSVVLSSQCPAESIVWLTETLKSVLVAEKIDTFEDLKSTITQTLWDEELLTTQTQDLGAILFP
jgi:hypothetical protein